MTLHACHKRHVRTMTFLTSGFQSMLSFLSGFSCSKFPCAARFSTFEALQGV